MIAWTTTAGGLLVNSRPYSSLNPLRTVGSALREALSSHYYTTEDSPAVTHTIVGYPRR
ncbi:hypothetical protein ACFWOJ_20095 [Streptomyces sp. NPDC058439]|uniref:hypothetical protein n=1 Tax=Streptomyces sp. NPDC058439 TaxID=3346500 RepID=UPI00365A4E5F